MCFPQLLLKFNKVPTPSPPTKQQHHTQCVHRSPQKWSNILNTFLAFWWRWLDCFSHNFPTHLRESFSLVFHFRLRPPLLWHKITAIRCWWWWYGGSSIDFQSEQLCMKAIFRCGSKTPSTTFSQTFSSSYLFSERSVRSTWSEMIVSWTSCSLGENSIYVKTVSMFKLSKDCLAVERTKKQQWMLSLARNEWEIVSRNSAWDQLNVLHVMPLSASRAAIDTALRRFHH